ncbi:MAG: hypothetical protein ACR2PS_05575 [Pseudomonadales bacterium]
MKLKIPTDVYVHPDSGKQCLYNTDSIEIETLDQSDRKIPTQEVNDLGFWKWVAANE